MRTKIALTTLLCIAGFTAAGTLMSAAEGISPDNEKVDAQALLASKVTLTQAVQTAEGKAGGKASSVDFRAAEGTSAPFYHVEVTAADGSQQDYAVDASTGELMKYAGAGDDENRDQNDGEGTGQNETDQN